MKEEQLLLEAKRRYSTGDVVKNPVSGEFNNTVFTILNIDKAKFGNNKNIGVPARYEVIKGTEGALYYHGKWAEIVQKIVTEYQLFN